MVLPYFSEFMVITIATTTTVVGKGNDPPTRSGRDLPLRGRLAALPQCGIATTDDPVKTYVAQSYNS